MSKVVELQSPVDGIYTITFESDKKYKYRPGQFLHLALDDYDPSAQWPESRCFSMQSNPTEETIKITYAVKGAFTKEMVKTLKTGSEVWLKLPYGDLFQQPHNKTNTVFIAGGTGITPFLSLFTDESFNEYINPKMYLGFRSKDYNIYQVELERVQQIRAIRYPYVKISVSYQDKEGVLDINKILSENGVAATYFISGPPTMIKKFRQILIDNGVPTEYVLTDDWE